MKVNLAIDKRAEAVIDDKLCINCGKCGAVCPTEAIAEYRKTVYCPFPDCGQGRGREAAARYFRDAKNLAVESVCSAACPLGIVPQAVAALVKRGDIEGAYALINEKNPMPWVCASICDHTCQDFCKRGNMIDTAVNMRGLERYVLSKSEAKPFKHVRRHSERIAVIGGGPAGLAAAFELSKAGYEATIFERDNRLGGALVWGIPDFRLDKEKLAGEIDRIISAGIKVRYNQEIGEDYTLDNIWEEGFRACIIAAGASEGIGPDIPGADSRMVYDGIGLMRRINGENDGDTELGEDIVVIGIGEFAADTARMLRRMEKKVTCVSMDDPGDSGISEESVKALAEEGIEFRQLIAPKQIINEGGKVKAVEFIKTEFTDDDKGRVKAHGIKGSEFNMFCDTVIFAMGRRCNVSKISNVETYPNGKIKTDSAHRTNKRMIFACGDATMDSGTVAEAMASGREAAAEVDAMLRGLQRAERRTGLLNAPDASIIYWDNVAEIRPQFERVVKEGEEDNETEGKFAEDILTVLRNAGIEETMHRFTYKFSDGKPKRKVAVIGGGIAGITAAVDLAKSGYRPVIFEKTPALGGARRWLSSRKRTDRELLEKELAKIQDSGIEVICNVFAGVKPDIRQLQAAGYEAVLFAIGESCGEKPDMENAGCRGVFDAVSLMGKLADCEKVKGVGRQAIVTGCDELTFDIARDLKEFCSQVTVLSPLGKGALRDNVASIAAALEDGVHLVTGIELSGINEENGKVKSIKCRVPEKNVVIDISCDTLVIGGTKRPDTRAIAAGNPKLDMDERGYIQVDERLITSMYGVFAIGDFDMTSIEAGHAGAVAVQSFMEGTEITAKARVKNSADRQEDIPKYEIFEGKMPPEGGFEVGRRVFDNRQAELEASRCLCCGYHRENSSLCIGCGICASVCPANAITLIPTADNADGAWPEGKQEEV